MTSGPSLAPDEEAWWRFLVDAGLVLARSLDFDESLGRIAELAVPGLADWCAVHILAVDGAVESLAVRHFDRAREPAVRQLRERFGRRPGSDVGIPAVIRSGRPELYESITDEALRVGSQDEEQTRLFLEVGTRSVMVIPIHGRERLVGAMLFAFGDSGRRYTQDDVERAIQFADRAGLAIENAGLFGEAAASAAARERFLGIASHELRNPLTTVLGATDLLIRRIQRQGLDEELVLEQLAVVRDQAGRMRAIIEQLLDLVRLGRGDRPVLELAPTDVIALLRREVEALVFRYPDAEVTTELPPGDCFVVVDPNRFAQIIANLLENAARYARHHGPIHVSARAEDKILIVRIADGGSGIPSPEREMIFEPFTRGEGSGGGGLGVGLWLSRRFAEAMGGTLELVDTEQTVFEVRVPSA